MEQSFGDRCSIPCVVVDSWPQDSCGDVLWWTVVAEPLLLVEPVCSETQEEQLSKVSREILTDLETSMTTEQVVTQLQQELFTLRAQVAAESGLADAVRAINSLTTALLRGREEDFQQWSKKTEHSSLV